MFCKRLRHFNGLRHTDTKCCPQSYFYLLGLKSQSYLPLMPTDGAPAATAAKAYSICTNFPEGLKNTVSDYCLMSNEEFFSYIMARKSYSSIK